MGLNAALDLMWGFPPGAQGGGAPIEWLLKASFDGPDLAAGEVPASLGTPYVEVGGPLTIVQQWGTFGVSASRLNIASESAGTWGGLGILAPGQERVDGLALFATIQKIAGRTLRVGYHPAAALNTTYNNQAELVIYYQETEQVQIISANGTAVLGLVLPANTDYQFVIVARTAGGYCFARGGSLADWTLLWVSSSGNAATIYPAISVYTIEVFPKLLDDMRMRALPAPFADDTVATVNQGVPVSGTPYTATADAIHDLTVTAPNPLSGSAALKYRVTDVNNYWTAYLNDAGAFRVDSVAAGTPTNRVSVAGVATADNTYTLRVICDGTTHSYYTLAGTTWTKRGGTVTLSHQDTATAIVPEATDFTLGALRSWPRRSTAYAVLDQT